MYRGIVVFFNQVNDGLCTELIAFNHVLKWLYVFVFKLQMWRLCDHSKHFQAYKCFVLLQDTG